MEHNQISLTAQEVARIRRELARLGDGAAGAEDERRFLATIEKDSPENMRPYLTSRTAFFDDSVTRRKRRRFPRSCSWAPATTAGSVLAANFAVTTDDAGFEAQSAAWSQRLASLGEKPRTRPAREEVCRLLEAEGWRPRDVVTPANAEFGARLSGALFVRAVASD